MSSIAAWGKVLIQFLAALAILHQDDLTKRINRITSGWRNGCFKKKLPLLPGLLSLSGILSEKILQITEKSG